MLIIGQDMIQSCIYQMGDSSRLLRRAFDARMRQLGVTGPQARLLLELSKAEGENQGHYAERLEVEPITLCRMVDRMEESGLLERRRDPADRRAWRVHLTPRSRIMIDHLREGVAQLEQDMLAGLDDAARQQFSQMMDAIRANLAQPLDTELADHG